MSAGFDIMLTTAMRLASGVSGAERGARAAAWRQIVDIVAQAGSRLGEPLRTQAFDHLGRLRDDVPAADRRMAAASLAARTTDPALAVMFGHDLPAVAAPFLSRVDLGEADWQQAIPAMPAAARNILRNRRDLNAAAVAVLRRYAAADLTLPSYAAPLDEVATDPTAVPAVGVTPIRDLVDRIAAYRQRVPMPQAAAPETDDAADVQGFTFETMADGTIDWVEGAPREAIIGMTIAETAGFGVAGVDGQAAGAWRRRAPFSDARLVVAGVGGAGGDWLISAAPLFNPQDGRFCGYRGSARRPRAGEHVGGPSQVGGIAPDAMCQLVHELRTPLNAIQGFAEMIDRQILGPAALRYRERARAIMAETQRLVAMVDDLDTTARLDSGRLMPEVADDADMAAIAVHIAGEHRAALAVRDVDLVLRGPGAPAPVAAAATIVERMMARLLAAACAVAKPGETIRADVERRGAAAYFTLGRPAALAGRDEADLLDPGYGPDGDWPDAPLLGLGFTLRLVGRLAAQSGGALTILPETFVLQLPGVAARVDAQPG